MDNNKLVKIRGKTANLADNVKQLASKIDDKKSEKNEIASKIEELLNKISNSDYLETKKTYDMVIDSINSVNNQIDNAKSSETISDLNSKMLNLTQNRKQLANSMKNIAVNNGFADIHNKMQRQKAQLSNINSLLNGLSKQKQTVKNQYVDMKSVLSNLKSQQSAQTNSNSIADRVSATKNAGMTALYRTDMQDNTVFQLIETEPSRSDSNTIASHSVDAQANQVDYVTRDTQELSGTYLLRGSNLKDAMNQFEKLSDWSTKYEFTINGFAYSQHAYISSISASTSATMNANTISVEITFQYARQANIKYAQNIITRKAPAKKRRGRRKRGKRRRKYIRVRPGMTYSFISNKTGVSIHKLMSMNKWPARSIPIGVKVRYK